MSTHELDAAIAEARRLFQGLRCAGANAPPAATDIGTSPSVRPAPIAATSPAAPPAPAARRDPNAGPPPPHYLKGPPQDWERFVTPEGVIPSGLGWGGQYWGPV